MIND
jgi:hypothetical protein